MGSSLNLASSQLRAAGFNICVLLLEAGLHLVADCRGGEQAVRLAMAHQMMIDELARIVIAMDDSPPQNCPSDQRSAPQA